MKPSHQDTEAYLYQIVDIYTIMSGHRQLYNQHGVRLRGHFVGINVDIEGLR